MYMHDNTRMSRRQISVDYPGVKDTQYHVSCLEIKGNKSGLIILFPTLYICFETQKNRLIETVLLSTATYVNNQG